MKNKNQLLKRVFIVSIVILLMCIITLQIGLKRLMSNVYNINDISDNIDKINVGDTINYTGNGYSDWEVLYIDKDNRTMDIISKTSPEEITFSYYNAPYEALNVLQETANKYADGTNAIKARSVAQSDLDNFIYDDKFWTADVGNNSIFHNSGVVNFTDIDSDIKLMPVVTINVDDASSLSVGSLYSASINDVNEWIVFEINGENTISLIPSNPINIIEDSNKICETIEDYVTEKLNEFKTDSVLNVRLLNSSDLDNLRTIEKFKSQSTNYIFYTDDLRYKSSNESYDYYLKRNYSYKVYEFSALYYYTWNRKFEYGNFQCSEKSYTLGFRPIVTIKFSDEKVQSKNIDDDSINIGDNVNYEAKGYSNWKVLSIDKENNTVDIISGGIVKNLLLQGLEDFDNVNTILQKEADEYKVGNNVISARSIEFNDFENLKKIGDKISARYWTNNTNVSKVQRGNDYYALTDKKINTLIINKSVGIGYYNSGTLDIVKEWVVLYSDASQEIYGSLLSPASSGPYSYMAGIRPVITLKLDDVKKVDESVVTKSNDESYITEQVNTNKSSSNVITYNKNNEVSASDESELVLKGNSEIKNSTNKNVLSKDKANNLIDKNYSGYNNKLNFIIFNLLIADLIVICIFKKVFAKKNEE